MENNKGKNKDVKKTNGSEEPSTSKKTTKSQPEAVAGPSNASSRPNQKMSLMRVPVVRTRTKSKRIYNRKLQEEIAVNSVFLLSNDMPRIRSSIIEKINEENSKTIMNLQRFSVNPICKEKWCQAIYINFRCRSDKMFENLHMMPKYIGPGPLSLVIQTTLNAFIKNGLDPLEVFDKWRYKSNTKGKDNAKVIEIKARKKKFLIYGSARSIRHPEDLAIYCREMCIKLNVCPNLFATERIENCLECLNITDAEWQVARNI